MSMSADLNPRPVSASFVEMDEIVQPSDLNINGSIFGGYLMSLMDKAGGISAFKYCGVNVVTVSVDQLVFKNPAPAGTLLSVKASVNRAFHTSMEVGILVTGLKPGESKETKLCSAYITYVAIGEDGKPIPVPPTLPETPEQIRRFREAEVRRSVRLALVERLANGSEAHRN